VTYKTTVQEKKSQHCLNIHTKRCLHRINKKESRVTNNKDQLLFSYLSVTVVKWQLRV